jgi:hypothetical protein
MLLQCCGFGGASHVSLEKSLEKAQRGAKLEFAAAPLASKKTFTRHAPFPSLQDSSAHLD